MTLPLKNTAAVRREAAKLQQETAGVRAFAAKLNNDWVPKLASMLAYTFLTSIFPLLLVLFAVAGFVIDAISPSSQMALQNTIAAALPAGIGRQVVVGALANLHRSAGVILIVGVLSAVFSGSRLFVSIENCTGIIFRLRARKPLPQNIMALGMTLLYVVLIPIMFSVSLIPSQLLKLVGFLPGPGQSILAQILGIAFGWIAAMFLFGAIYIVVPNRPVQVREVWKGTLIASALLVVYELVFPLYTSLLLRPSNYGSVAGFILVVLVFFYYLAFILLFGMEINSWASGQRQTAGDLQTVMHEVQVHKTTLGAAGPSAGSAAEDISHRQGAEVANTNQQFPTAKNLPRSYPAKPTVRREVAKNAQPLRDKNRALAPTTPSRFSTDLKRVVLATFLLVSGRSIQALWRKIAGKKNDKQGT